MKNLVKTTLTIPEDMLKAAKLMAVHNDMTLSQVLREALEEKVYKRKKELKKNAMRLAGKFKLGIAKLYNKRSDLYEEHLRRKMAY